MNTIPKDPSEWDLGVWGWVIFMVAFGGVYNWVSSCKQGKRPTSVISLLGELTLCEVIGIPVFMALHAATGFPVGLNVALSIAAGHYGTRFICKAEAFANAYACKVSGISPEELKRFEDDANDAANLAGCFDFGVAYSLVKRGEAVRHLTWPEGQFISMSTTGMMPVKASDLWSKPNSDYARRREDQTVLVMPAITQMRPDGVVVGMWSPTALELTVPGWMRVDTTQAADTPLPHKAEAI